MKKKLVAVLMAVAMVATMTACSSSGSSDSSDSGSEEEATTDSGDGLKMGITYWTASDFFQTIADSITEEAKADGNTVVVSDAGQDSEKQIQIIEDFIAQDVDVVFLNPVDRDAITPALQELKEAGITVVNFDSSVAALEMVDAYVATDNYQAGVLCGEAMLKDFPDGGEIAVLNYPANSACNDREQGFLDTIGDKFEVVATFDAQGDVSEGQEITSDILQAHPNLTAIFSINDQAGMGAYAAITGAGMDVAIYGVDGNPDAKTVINQEGSIYKMTAAQSPIKMGKTCYETAIKLLNGEELESFQIDVEVFEITADNVGDYLDGWQ
ncbi:MAG: sugar ABC transporter substrate-binding protein [Dorea sp.]